MGRCEVNLAYAAMISLEDAVDRRDISMRQAPVEFELIPAVDGRSWDADDRAAHFDTKRSLRRYGRPLAGGEMGCTLSHLKALQAFLTATEGQSDALGLISEDDLVWDEDAATFLDAVVNVGCHELTFFYCHVDLEPWQYRTVHHIGDSRIVRPFPVGLTTMCYLVSRPAARAIVAAAKNSKPYWLADDYLLFRDLGIDVLTTLDGPVRRQDVSSTIEAARQSAWAHIRPIKTLGRGDTPIELRFKSQCELSRHRIWFWAVAIMVKFPLWVRNSLIGRLANQFINDVGSGDQWLYRLWLSIKRSARTTRSSGLV